MPGPVGGESDGAQPAYIQLARLVRHLSIAAERWTGAEHGERTPDVWEGTGGG